MFRQCSWDSLETCDAGDDEKGAQRPAGKVIAKGVVNTRHTTEGLQTSDDSGGSCTLLGAQWNPRKASKRAHGVIAQEIVEQEPCPSTTSNTRDNEAFEPGNVCPGVHMENHGALGCTWRTMHGGTAQESAAQEPCPRTTSNSCGNEAFEPGMLLTFPLLPFVDPFGASLPLSHPLDDAIRDPFDFLNTASLADYSRAAPSAGTASGSPIVRRDVSGLVLLRSCADAPKDTGVRVLCAISARGVNGAGAPALILWGGAEFNTNLITIPLASLVVSVVQETHDNMFMLSCVSHAPTVHCFARDREVRDQWLETFCIWGVNIS